jgi:hypothetical protein
MKISEQQKDSIAEWLLAFIGFPVVVAGSARLAEYIVGDRDPYTSLVMFLLLVIVGWSFYQFAKDRGLRPR